MPRLRTLTLVIFAAVLVVHSAYGQTELSEAEAAVKAAEAAGAPLYAKEIYDQAQSRLTLARTSYNAQRSSERETARLYAAEALRAAQAAEARARLHMLSTEATNLAADVSRFGGTAPSIQNAVPSVFPVERGGTSKQKLAMAEEALARAKGVGAEGVAPDMLKEAESNISTAKKILQGTRNSDSADHLSFNAEMLARRAEYLALASVPSRVLPSLRLERTRLAAAAVEAEAVAERQRRDQAEREASELRARLADERAAREAEEKEAMRLRDQLEADRKARLEASARLEELRANYESALNRAGSQSEVEALRRQVEDQQLSLSAIREREIRSEEAMRAEITRLQQELSAERQRGDQTVAAREQQLLDAQTKLDQARIERENADRLRQEAEVRHQQAIREAENRLEAVQAESAQMRQQLASTQAELDRTKAELARREETQAMQAQLNAIAPTRMDERGLIVTLPGLLFETGKSTLAPGAKNILDKLAEQLRTNARASITIEGHTDSVGSDDSNMILSEARAKAVRDYLLGKGVDGSRIETAGRGESVPLASNDTAAGRQQNRRVELIITQ